MGAAHAPKRQTSIGNLRQVSTDSDGYLQEKLLFERQLTSERSDAQRLGASIVAGSVSFMLATIMSVNFGILVFAPVSGAVPSAVQMTIVGVGILGNGALCCLSCLPCVVVTADNGVVAPIVAQMVLEFSKHIKDDPDALKATSVAAVSLACLCFGCTQLALVRLKVAQMVKFLPYSIPMGFLSGIGLELCSAISIAGHLPSQCAAAVLATILCLGSWWRGWPLSILFPVLLVSSVSLFYLAGAPSSWLLEFDGDPATATTAWLWSKDTLSAIQWEVLFKEFPKALGILILLGSFQNILFAEVFARTPGLKNDVEPDQVLSDFGKAFFSGGFFGFTGGFHNMACFSLSRELKATARAPSGFVSFLSCVLWSVGIGPILRVPRFVFAGLLLWVGLKFLRTYLFQPARMLPRSETAVIICVAGVMKLNGFAVGVLAGLVLALIGMVGELATLSCVQVVSTGHEARSNAMRSVRAEQLLLSLGHGVLVLRLAPGFVFFATSAQLLKIVEERLGDKAEPWLHQDPWIGDSSDTEDEMPELRGASLSKVVLDFTLCRGFDGSVIGVLQQLSALGSRRGFQICLAGLQPSHQLWIKSNIGASKPSFFVDLDRALEYVEDQLLASQGFTHAKETRRPTLVSASLPQRLNSDETAKSALRSVSGGWALLFLYSDTSASSRSARPAVAQAMSLLDRHCELFEAPEDACPELTKQYGPGPVLVLFRGGEPSLKVDSRRMNAGSHAGATGVAMLPVAKAISQEIDQHIFSVENKVTRAVAEGEGATTARKGVNDLTSEMNEALGIPSPVDSSSPVGTPPESPLPTRSAGNGEVTKAQTVADVTMVTEVVQPSLTRNSTGTVVRRKSAKKAPQRRMSLGADRDLWDVNLIWPQFLQLAGVPKESILERLPKLPEALTGPRVLKKGEHLFYKGAAQVAIYFVVNGLFSLWNEGRGHHQSSPAQTTNHRRPSSEVHLIEHNNISKGTSRLIRVGPGWTFGGNLCQGLASKPTFHTLTCTAETDARILELRSEIIQDLWNDEAGLVVAVQGLVMHFNSQLLQHTASLLSDMHTLVFAEPQPLWKSQEPAALPPVHETL